MEIYPDVLLHGFRNARLPGNLQLHDNHHEHTRIFRYLLHKVGGRLQHAQPAQQWPESDPERELNTASLPPGRTTTRTNENIPPDGRDAALHGIQRLVFHRRSGDDIASGLVYDLVLGSPSAHIIETSSGRRPPTNHALGTPST